MEAVLEKPILDDMSFEDKGEAHFVVIPVAGVDKLSMNAIRYSKFLNGEIIAVHILLNVSDRDTMEHRWKMQNTDIPLIILESPNGSLIAPLITYVDDIRNSHPESIITIVLPVLTGLKWWQRILHNQTARLIEKAFKSYEGVVTMRVPYLLENAF